MVVTTSSIISTLSYLQQEAQRLKLPLPMGDKIVAEYDRDPFLLLVACLLSLRARDTATYPVCTTLFARIRTPQELVQMPQAELEVILKPIGFYRAKARVLQQVAQILIERHGGRVPKTEAELLALPGVGRKTANFMLALAFGIPALCVDTHVHRLANLFGWVKTRTPEETETALKKLLPSEWWVACNMLLVMWGQQVCTPRVSKKNRPHHDAVCPCGNQSPSTDGHLC